MYEYFKDKSPFDGDGQLRNISNGVVAVPEVNVNITREAGQKILHSMTGATLNNY